MKTAILGGGITGVTLAALLSEKGADWRLFEASSRLGGLCRSETVDGFVADTAGGHIIFSKHQEVMDFILGALGEGNHHRSPRKSAIYYRDRYVQYPFENGLADLPPEDNFACLAGYVESNYRRRDGEPAPTNFREWCLWRFGEGICDKFMFPYNEKLWNVDLAEMSSCWVAGRVPDAPVEDVLRSSIGIRTEGYSHQSTFWYPLEGGFETIVTKIAGRLDQDRIHVGRRVTSLEFEDGAYLVDGERYDRVVSTIPLPELAKIVAGVPDAVSRAFRGLQYTSLASVIVAIDAPPRTDRSWIYFPHEETGPFNRLTHLSNYSPRNAPDGASSVMLEVTYRGELDAGEDFQRGLVRNLADCQVCEEDRVLFTKVWKNKYAYILYTHDLEENLATVKSWLASRGVDLLGRFGNYDYFNSDQCIKAVMDYVAALD
ncbi:MAG: FAD-dependent oxidoreductase [Planctomycetota bacterium]